MTDAIDLTTEQRKTLITLLRRFLPGVAVWAYGSRVKWTARPNSDLDLVAFATPAQRPQVAELKDALAESNLPFPVDLHVWDEVPERFREIIRKEYVVVQEAKRAGSGLNMGGWKDITLGEFVALQRGHDLTEPERRPGNVPVMGSAGQNGFHDTVLAKGPGIVIGRSGASFGQVHFCTTDYWPHNTGLYVTDFKGNDPRFAYYLLKVLDLDRYNSGSAQPSLNRNFIYPIPIRVPEPAEQKAIAHILGTLDDKIELNRRMNETLEAMARALFKSWFIDFDPVRRNAARARNQPSPGLRPPSPSGRGAGGESVREALSHPLPLGEGRGEGGVGSHAFDHLFPDSFEDSELGEIPKGWHVRFIRDLTSTIQYGFTQSASSDLVGPRFLRITDIQDGKVDWSTVPFCEVTPEEHERYRLKPGDVLVARTGASTGENIYLSYAPDAVFASYLVRFQFSDMANARLVGAFMRTQSYFEYVTGGIGGSAQPNASAQVLAGVQLVVPTSSIARTFFDLVTPLDLSVVANANESRTLAALRDTLLPKLITGELRVNKAERFIAGAV